MYNFQPFVPIPPFVPVTIPMSIQMNNDMYQMMMLHWAYNMGRMSQQTTPYLQSVKQPTFQQPTVKQPTFQQPTFQQPTFQQPTFQQPTSNPI